MRFWSYYILHIALALQCWAARETVHEAGQSLPCSACRRKAIDTDRATKAELRKSSAAHARDLISRRSDGIGAFMSVFPSDYVADPSLANLPIGGLEYFAPAGDGDLYILAMPISKVSG